MSRLVVFIGVLLLACCAPPQERGPVVLAAASLQGALDEAAAQWVAAGHPRPVLSYAGSHAIARQVEAGAPADIVVLADGAWMDRLQRGGYLARGDPRDLVSNTLVVVHPAIAGASDDISESRSVAAALGKGIVAIGDPQAVPAGRYARAALESLGLWAAIAPRTIVTDNVRAALALAERGEVDAAIVYASDAAASPKVFVAARVPAGAHPPVRYPAAVLARAKHPDGGAFLAHLASPAARRVFLHHGFAPLPGDD
ncbi:molybdate ABC transporter substrate-binding protein [Pelagerythrobacter marensis]|uniref:Molybdate ABC transporter substrate-binding protein n=1 Tax=Pelagerythrobacter marensis TaxID=543877 RepID=A0ABZ2CZQ8_9SPHN